MSEGVRCATCGAALVGADDACDFCVATAGRADAPEPAAPEVPPEPPAAGPPGNLRIVRGRETISLIWRRHSWSNVVAFAGLVLANVFLFAWLAREGAGSATLATLFAIATAATYAVLVQLINRVTVDASRERLRISSRPLPWWGGVAMRAEDVVEIRCDQRPLAFRHAGRVGLTAITTDGPISLGDVSDDHAAVAAEVCADLAQVLQAKASVAR